MENWQKDVLLRHRVDIVNDLYVDYVLDHLLARQILNEEHKENIYSQSGRHNRARCLLDLLPRCGPAAYDEFVNSLKEPYDWLHNTLSQESAINVASSYYSNAALPNQQVCKNTDEIHQQLAHLSSVISTCGQSLCAVGDALSKSLNKLKSTKDASSDTSVFRQNFINLSKNAESHSESNQGLSMERLRGGGETESNENVNINSNGDGIEVSSVTSMYSSDLIALGKDEKSDEVGKTKDEVYIKEQIISIGIQGIKEECYVPAEVQSIPNGQTDGVSSVDCSLVTADVHQKVAFAEEFKASLNDELLKDSPDSGMGDVQLNQVVESIDSLKIMSSSGVSSLDKEILIQSPMDMNKESGNADKFGMRSISQRMTTAENINTDLAPVLDEFDALRHRLNDLTRALNSVAQLLNKMGVDSNNFNWYSFHEADCLSK